MMKIKDIHKIIQGLSKKYVIYAPQQINNELKIELLKDPQKFDISGKIPVNSFKHILFPDSHTLYDYEGNVVKETNYETPDLTLFGLTIFDIKALDFFDHVLEKDPYFQARRRRIVIVGQSYVPEIGDFADEIEKNYEENVLEHVQFDIFIKRIDKNEFKLYTGSRKGQKILEYLGFSEYDHIQFMGLVCDNSSRQIHDNVLKTFNHEVWKEWGKLCLNCGKCTIACPTCYCFETESIRKKRNAKGFWQGSMIRKWSSCFFTEFTEIAGNIRFLKESKDRIYNWYFHKWVRNFDELCIPGCVGCGRCDRVCPAGIKRTEVYQSLKQALEKAKKKP